VLFIATAEAGDDEMVERIARHRAERPPAWITVEAPLDPAGSLPAGGFDAVVLDCVTFWISNLLMDAAAGERNAPTDGDIARLVNGLVDAARFTGVPWFVVSNEVGLGVVPPYPLGRAFRDLLGTANQRLAAHADRVTLVVAGLPLMLKGEPFVGDTGGV
jgi:adenosyl cobinamide kinase/adenosyl cobinamide phosphate guanylyltransferase